jgi:hypothetical protein
MVADQSAFPRLKRDGQRLASLIKSLHEKGQATQAHIHYLLAVMPRTIPKWPREKIQQELQRDIAGLPVEFADQAWAQELIPLLRELHDLAAEPHPRAERLAGLKGRVTAVLRKHRVKGMDGYLWMIDCLGDTNVDT